MYLLIILLTVSTLTSSQGSQKPACNIGCARCDSISAVCFACGTGYQLTLQGQCVLASIPQCSLYLNQDQCAQCVATNSLTNNGCQFDFSRCIQNISSSRCGRCLPELTNDKGNCVGVINCEVYSGKKCVKCASGYILKNNLCAALADSCYVLDQSTGICRICAPGYALVGYKCISITITVENCYLYDEKGSCYLCKRGYALKGNACSLQNQLGNVQTEIVKPPVLSLTNNRANPAQGSPSGLLITQITNIDVQANSRIVGVDNIYCSKFLNGTCIQCYVSYYLKNGTCFQVDTLCQKFNYNTTKCQGCYKGYTLNSNSVCNIQRDPLCRAVNKDNKCTQCYSTYFLNANGVCQAANTFCRESNNDGSCKSCYNGYEILGTTCVLSNKNNSIVDPFCLRFVENICTTCANGFFVSNITGKCTPANPNSRCLTTDIATGLCTKCLASLLLLDGKCIYPLDNCVKYSANQTCIQCSSSAYQLKNGICNNKDITCAEYDTNGKCTKCIVTYYLIKGKCIYPAYGQDPLCIDYVSGFCITCKAGSYLVNFICKAIDKNCLSFNYQKMTCERCTFGLTPQGAICV